MQQCTYKRRNNLKRNTGDVWSNDFNYFEEKNIGFSVDLLEDSYKELSKIYQKDHKKDKVPKKAKQAWS